LVKLEGIVTADEDEDVKVDSVELDNGMGDKSGKRRARSLG
jgi:hypothetical protein